LLKVKNISLTGREDGSEDATGSQSLSSLADPLCFDHIYLYPKKHPTLKKSKRQTVAYLICTRMRGIDVARSQALKLDAVASAGRSTM
jgi:hypothetical protein